MSERGIPGFDDTDPPDEELFSEAGYQRSHGMSHDPLERRAADSERRRADALVDRKLNAVYRHGKGLEQSLGDLVTVVDKLATSVSAMQTDQKKNNEMTERILVITSGGKFIVGVIKFFGVIAVPLTAIYTLYYVMTHGGSPPTLP